MSETWLVPDTNQKRLVLDGPKDDQFQYLHWRPYMICPTQRKRLHIWENWTIKVKTKTKQEKQKKKTKAKLYQTKA